MIAEDQLVGQWEEDQLLDKIEKYLGMFSSLSLFEFDSIGAEPIAA